MLLARFQGPLKGAPLQGPLKGAPPQDHQQHPHQGPLKRASLQGALKGAPLQRPLKGAPYKVLILSL